MIKVPPLKIEPVEVPEWDTTVFIKELSAKNRAKLEELVAAKKVSGDVLRKHVLLYCLVTAEGVPELTSEADADNLMESSAAAIERIFSSAMALSGLLGSIDETVKN